MCRVLEGVHQQITRRNMNADKIAGRANLRWIRGLAVRRLQGGGRLIIPSSIWEDELAVVSILSM